MKVYGRGLSEEGFFCAKCGRIFNNLSELTKVGEMGDVACPSCGQKESRFRLRKPFDSGKFGEFKEAFHPNGRSAFPFGIFDGEPVRLFFQEQLGQGKWVLTSYASSLLELNINSGSVPEKGGFLVSWCSGFKNYIAIGLVDNGDIKETLERFYAFLREAKNRSRKKFLESIKGEAVDIGSSSFSNHKWERDHAKILSDEGWVQWERSSSHRGATTSNYWFRPSKEGVQDLIKMLGCRIDNNGTLLVPRGEAGRFIGKGGSQIKMLSKYYGQHLKVKEE